MYAVGDTGTQLIKKAYENFGNVDMYVGNVYRGMEMVLIESPEIP